MTEPLLSLCIPTYNRSNYLDESLSVIANQLKKNQHLMDLVEVIVSDNASTDNTAEVVFRYMNELMNVKYFRNSVNIGCDENCIRSVSNSSGKYCWLLGDDDYIVNGGLAFVVAFLSASEVSVLSLESRTFTSIDNVFSDVVAFKNENVLFIEDHSIFFEKGFCIGLLCSMVFNRKLWLNTDRVNYKAGWSYYEIALKMISQSRLKMAHLCQPLVVTREDALWVKGGTEFFFFLSWKQILENLRDYGYNEANIKKKLDQLVNSLFLILSRAKGHDLVCSFANYKLLYLEFSAYPFHLMLATCLYLLPNWSIKLMRDLRKKLINKL